MLALLIIFFIRLASAAAMLFFPVFGYFLTLIADSIDLWIMVIFNSSFSIHYNLIDKSLDLITLSVALIISLKFSKLSKNTSIFLYAWRLLGFILFFFTSNKTFFLFFPNIFENFFLFCIIQRKFFPKFEVTKKNLWIILILVAIPKIFQEWLLHASGNDMKIYGWIVDAVENSGLKSN
jgi:hypothetical protein